MRRVIIYIYIYIYFILFSPNEQRARGGGGGVRCQTFFLFLFPCSADHERDWPPCKVVFFGLATNALNVRNNNNNIHTYIDTYVGNRCSRELVAESRASAACATVTLSSGADAASFLESMAQQADDHVDVCCQIPDEAVTADLTDTTMFGTTSLLLFSGLVESVPIDAVVKVMYIYKESNASHIVVIGPNGFQMCSGLQVLRCGLPYRHTVAALVTEPKRHMNLKGSPFTPGGDLRYSHGR